MRNPLLLIALLIAGTHLAPAVSAQVSPGIRAGLNVSTFAGDDAGSPDAKLGLLAGAYLNYAFTPALSVQPEVLFSQKGASETSDGIEVSYNLSYIDIPVLFKYTLPTGTNLLPRIYAGPQLSILVNESVSAEGFTVDVDEARSTDFGFVVGADVGARLAGRQEQFGVGLRYTLGLSDAFDDLSVRNNVFAVSAYFGF